MSLLRKQLSNVMNSIPMPIFVSDVNGYLIYVNDTYSDLFHLSSQELVGQDSNNFRLDVQDNDFSRLTLCDNIIRNGGEIQHVPKVAIYQDDSKYIYDIIKLPFNIDKHEPDGILTVMMEVTERIKAEDDLHELNASLEEKVNERTLEIKEKNIELETSLSDLFETQGRLVETEKIASLSRLVIGIAHSLNTPLGNAILSSSYLIKKHKELDTHYKSNHLTKELLSELINDFNQSSLILSNSLSEAVGIIDILRSYQFIQDNNQKKTIHLKEYVVSVLKVENSHHDYSLVVRGSDKLISTNTFLLEKMISSIYSNIVEHAFHNKEKSDCLIVVECQVKNEQVEISFIDNGNGISEDIIEHVAEPLYSTKRGQGKLGLGLYVVHSIITNIFKAALT